MINIEGKLCNKVQTMANTINNYFTAPLPHTQSNIPPNILDSLNYLVRVFKHPFPSVNITPVTNKEIKDIIKLLKWKSSHG
jgi:hypothetical protein